MFRARNQNNIIKQSKYYIVCSYKNLSKVYNTLKFSKQNKINKHIHTCVFNRRNFSLKQKFSKHAKTQFFFSAKLWIENKNKKIIN